MKDLVLGFFCIIVFSVIILNNKRKDKSSIRFYELIIFILLGGIINIINNSIIRNSVIGIEVLIFSLFILYNKRNKAK